MTSSHKFDHARLTRLQTRLGHEPFFVALTAGACTLVLVAVIFSWILTWSSHFASEYIDNTPDLQYYLTQHDEQFAMFRGVKIENVDLAVQFAGQAAALAAVMGAGALGFTMLRKRRRVDFDEYALYVHTDGNPENSLNVPWDWLVNARFRNNSVAGKEFPQVILELDDESEVVVTLAELFAKHPEPEILNAFHAYAPDCVIDEALLQHVRAQFEKSSYTELWFNSLHEKSERERLGELTPGTVLNSGRFNVVQTIGTGGQGTAYLVEDNAADDGDRLCVLKEYILPTVCRQALERTVMRMRSEETLLQRLDHDKIVKCSGSFVEDKRGYLIMEYVRGTSLKELVHRQGALPEAQVIDVAIQVAEILNYLHTQKPHLVHRDVSPENIVLQDDGTIKLVDFNLAFEETPTRRTMVAGKQHYLPPEQFRGKPTTLSDIYAFGCTLHYMLTGEEPEPLSSSKPQSRNAAVSAEMNQLVETATQLDQTKRHKSAQEMVTLLRSLVQPEGASDGEPHVLNLRSGQREKVQR